MSEEKNNINEEKSVPKKLDGEKVSKAPVSDAPKGKSVYGQKRAMQGGRKFKKPEREKDEFEQRIVDLARVTRVMAGGKRMRFRACVVIGDKKGRVGIGMDKGADVPAAVNKAVTKAKKNIIEVPIVNETIPHQIYHKKSSAKILIKPARKGKGVIAGGAARIVFELSGIKNITAKILGSNNNVNVAKCTIEALDNIKKVEKKKTVKTVKTENNVNVKADEKDSSLINAPKEVEEKDITKK